jgi:hypothetical protein
MLFTDDLLFAMLNVEDFANFAGHDGLSFVRA